jgi:hypothetical protein
MIQTYPLQWPAGWPRTDKPQSAQFKTSLSSASTNLVHELRLLGATDIIINSNMRVRADGLPYSRQGSIDDTGVAVYFTLNGEPQCIPCDKWVRLDDNVQAVRKTVEALRGLERWGAKEMVNAAFRGFKALPEAIILGETTARAWWEVLQVSQTADWEVIEAAYKRLLHRVHPDKGGSDREFQELQNAYRQAEEAR